MQYVVGELGNVKSTDFGARTGGFNVLNVPDNLYVSSSQFWTDYNQPWLSNAVARNDVILMATKPEFGFGSTTFESPLFRRNETTLKLELSGFGREYSELLRRGYRYNPVNNQMER